MASKETQVTHEELRKLAVRWLTNTCKCSVVLSELVSAAFETPDAIGWRFGTSTLVECKVSRSDWLRNADKPSVRAGRAVGCRKYFLTPAELISPGDLGESTGMSEYGLLWTGQASAGYVKVVKEAQLVESNQQQEIRMLTSALRRVRTREFLTIVAGEDKDQVA